MRRTVFLLGLVFVGWALPFPSIETDPSVEEALDEQRQESIEDFPSPKDIEAKRDIFADSESLEVNNTLACDESNAPGRHMIYCSGKLLHAVMATHVYPDSKTFVDRPIRRNHTGETVLAEFERRFPGKLEELEKTEVAKFLDEYFEPEGQELIECDLKDWQEVPASIGGIVDKTLRQFALDLHNIWRDLCRKVDPIVAEETHRFSLIPVPHPFIVPGGRFRESYYWDAYWIVKGLLVSGMRDTVKGMIRNYAQMVEQYGFVPNGGRIYYLQRSQPPLLAPTVYEYYQNTRDKDFLREMLPVLEKEFLFWKMNRNVTVKIGDEDLTLYQYRTPLRAPRPESYREDITTAAGFKTLEQKKNFFQNLASAAESGWDFSTRWLQDNTDLSSIETTNILPVDLNAFLCYNMQIITYLHSESGNVNKEFKWMADYLSFRETFKKVFYVRKGKGWYDYNIRTKEHNMDFYPSMAVPLFAQCYDPLNTKMFEEVYDKMDEMGAFNFTGGIPTSLYKKGHQQWDFPNGWSPLNHMIIEGLRKSGNPKLQQRAFELAEKWVFSNLDVFLRHKSMWEKYNVVSSKPMIGFGGEYVNQAGFGWTNGVILDLLSTYCERLRFPDAQPPIVPVPAQFRRNELTRAASSLSVLPALLALLFIF